MNEFSKHFNDALTAICDRAYAAMVAEPERCREIRQQAERDIAALPETLAPDPAWPTDQRQAFELWRGDLIQQQRRKQHAEPDHQSHS